MTRTAIIISHEESDGVIHEARHVGTRSKWREYHGGPTTKAGTQHCHKAKPPVVVRTRAALV